jgi:hypothetical protein
VAMPADRRLLCRATAARPTIRRTAEQDSAASIPACTPAPGRHHPAQLHHSVTRLSPIRQGSRLSLCDRRGRAQAPAGRGRPDGAQVTSRQQRPNHPAAQPVPPGRRVGARRTMIA